MNKALKDLTEQYRRSFEILHQKSEEKYIKSLNAGAVVHKQNGFYYDEDRQEFQAICDELREQAHKVIDGITAGLTEETMKAPSTEAVNVITLMSARKNVSADEIDNLMTKYGHECPMVYNALLEKAESLGYRDFKPHPITKEAENMTALSNIIDRTFSAARAEGNMVSTLAAYDSTIDMALPTGE